MAEINDSDMWLAGGKGAVL